MIVKENSYKIAFIIAHKYIQGYKSFLEKYINNILNFYPESLIIVVDNNSHNPKDIFSKLPITVNIVTNTRECKFEIGAYSTGINFLIENNLTDKYDFYVMSQDTYFLNKKYDFNLFIEKNVEAASIICLKNDFEKRDILYPILDKIGLNSNLEKTDLCWCNSFIVSKNKIVKLYDYIKDIVVTTRYQSEASERYLGRILFELNNFKNDSIDGNDENYYINNNVYNCLTLPDDVNIDNKYFVKICQQKNEGTLEKSI